MCLCMCVHFRSHCPQDVSFVNVLLRFLFFEWKVFEFAFSTLFIFFFLHFSELCCQQCFVLDSGFFWLTEARESLMGKVKGAEW